MCTDNKVLQYSFGVTEDEVVLFACINRLTGRTEYIMGTPFMFGHHTFERRHGEFDWEREYLEDLGTDGMI
jgi:hypothetical protein